MNGLSNLETLTPTLCALFSVAMAMQQQQCLGVHGWFLKSSLQFSFQWILSHHSFHLCGDDLTETRREKEIVL